MNRISGKIVFDKPEPGIPNDVDLDTRSEKVLADVATISAGDNHILNWRRELTNSKLMENFSAVQLLVVASQGRATTKLLPKCDVRESIEIYKSLKKRTFFIL